MAGGQTRNIAPVRKCKSSNQAENMSARDKCTGRCDVTNTDRSPRTLPRAQKPLRKGGEKRREDRVAPDADDRQNREQHNARRREGGRREPCHPPKEGSDDSTCRRKEAESTTIFKETAATYAYHTKRKEHQAPQAALWAALGDTEHRMLHWLQLISIANSSSSDRSDHAQQMRAMEKRRSATSK